MTCAGRLLPALLTPRAGALTTALLGLVGLAGCARVVVSETTGYGRALVPASGVAVHLPRPYLLVTSLASPPGLPPLRRTAELVLLPDLDHPQWIRVRPGLGGASAHVTLSHGMLAAYEESRDGQAAESLSAAGKSLSTALEARLAAFSTATEGGDGLARTIELFAIVARDDESIDLIPVPEAESRRLLARGRFEPSAPTGERSR